METISLWEDTANHHHSYPSLKGQHSTDVVIIGAGFTGISTSYHLQKKGINTIVLEKETVGSGASGKNGGMMNTGYKLSASELIKKWGVEDAKRLDAYALDSIEAVKQISQENKIDCALKQSGHIALSANKTTLKKFNNEQYVLEKYFNRDVEVFDHTKLKEEVSTSYYQAGLLDPLSHSFHPLNYVKGLAQAASKDGAAIYETSPVNKIEKTNTGFLVYTDKGTVQANDVVAATDGYTQKFLKELYHSILPISSFVIATEKLENDMVKLLIPKERNLYDTINLTNYFRITPDSRIILGGSGITYPAKEKFFSELYKKLVTIFPQLTKVRIDYKWGGLIGATIDKFPVIGKTNDGIYYATGYTGHGAAQSTLHGQLLAKCITQEERINTIFEDTRLKRIPLSSQKEFMIHSANLYFRLLDRLG